MSDIKKEFTELRKEYIRKYFGRMNDRQFEGVVTANGPVLILAGAGSGKTTVLVNRIASLIRFGNAYYSDFVPPFINEDTLSRVKTIESGSGDDRIFAVDPVRPWEILAITFTNRRQASLKSAFRQCWGRRVLMFGQAPSIRSAQGCCAGSAAVSAILRILRYMIPTIRSGS